MALKDQMAKVEWHFGKCVLKVNKFDMSFKINERVFFGNERYFQKKTFKAMFVQKAWKQNVHLSLHFISM